MREDGTVAERQFLKLPAEYDSLQHKIDHIKRHGTMVPDVFQTSGHMQTTSIKTLL